MPTPRTSLDTMRKTGVHGRFGLATDGEHGEFDYYWKARFELARGLLDALAQEKRPMIVVGDFNTPDHGELYKLFSSAMTDSFAAVGTGARATFPADVGGKLFELGPWLRLDYLFAGKGWMPIGCEVEPAVRAQHLAVMGRFQLSPAN